MTEPATPQLTEDAVREIEAMFPHAEYQPTLSSDEVPPCEFCKGTIDDHKANCVVPHVHALCRTAQGLQLDLQSRTDSYLELEEAYTKRVTENAGLREQLAEAKGRNQTLLSVNSELIEGNHAAHVALDAAGVKREDVVWEGPVQHVTEYPVCDRIEFLQSQLAEAEHELHRRRNGDELPSDWTGIDVGDGFPNLYLYSRADVVAQAKARLDELQSQLAQVAGERDEARRAAFKEAIATAVRVIKLNNPAETAGAVAVCAALELDLAALEAAEKGERDG